jgi:DNA-binding NarL/FixJ family response regulator
VKQEVTMPRVLLSGDHPGIRRGLEASQALAGCDMMTAAGNVDAVHTLRTRAIDVVVTDPALPDKEADPVALIERRADMGLGLPEPGAWRCCS